MNEIVNAITPALQKLSEIFCVSVDAIKAHGMEYVMMYGKYHLATSTLQDTLASLIFSTLGVCFLWGVGYMLWSIDHDCESKKNWVISGSIVIGLIVLFSILSNVVPYIVSPEIYSIQAVLNLVKG